MLIISGTRLSQLQILALFITAFYLNSLCGSVSAYKTPEGKIKHLLVLCLENHSFDHLLGHLEGIGTLTGAEYNLADPADPNSQKYFVGTTTRTFEDPDPPHDFEAVYRQQRGANLSGPIVNTGFAQEYAKIGGEPQRVMDMYREESVPVISTLARNFKVLARWYSSIPGPTEVNKIFLHAASTLGAVDWCGDFNCTQYPLHLRSIYDSLEESHYSYSIHYHDWCEVVDITPMNWRASKFVNDQDFKLLYAKMKSDTLDTYTFLVPRIDYQDPDYPFPNTQHPGEDIRGGEQLLKSVYENLRNSPSWESSALLVVYDEHGGFYDSIPTDYQLPNPNEGIKAFPFEYFDFKHIGVRVPAILISPWVAHSVDTNNVFEHSAVPATIKTFFSLKSDFLNSRDRASNVFLTQEELLPEMRTDCPTQLPEITPSFEVEPRYLYKYQLGATGVNLYNSEETIELGMLLITRFPEASRERMRRIIDRMYNETVCYFYELELKRALGFQTQRKTPTKHLGFINECQTYITRDLAPGYYVAIVFEIIFISYLLFVAKYFDINNFIPIITGFSLVFFWCDLRHAISLCFSFLVGSNIIFYFKSQKKNNSINDLELQQQQPDSLQPQSSQFQQPALNGSSTKNDNEAQSELTSNSEQRQLAPSSAQILSLYIPLIIAFIAFGMHLRKYLPLFILEVAVVTGTALIIIQIIQTTRKQFQNETTDKQDESSALLLQQTNILQCNYITSVAQKFKNGETSEKAMIISQIVCLLLFVGATIFYGIVMQSSWNLFDKKLSRCMFEETFAYQLFFLMLASLFSFFGYRYVYANKSAQTKVDENQSQNTISSYFWVCFSSLCYGVFGFFSQKQLFSSLAARGVSVSTLQSLQLWTSISAFLLEMVISSIYFIELNLLCLVTSALVSYAGNKFFDRQHANHERQNKLNSTILSAGCAVSAVTIVVMAILTALRTDPETFFFPQTYC